MLKIAPNCLKRLLRNPRDTTGEAVRLQTPDIHRRHAVRRTPAPGTGATDENYAVYTRFVDLRKSYDSVDRELLWEVLTRAGEPDEIITVTPHIQNGMLAGVRMDDGSFSDWFEGTQGLRQGRVMSPLLFSIFAAALEVLVERFSKDDVIRIGALGRTRGRGGQRDGGPSRVRAESGVENAVR